MACGGYLFIWFRYNLESVRGLIYAVCGGVVALASLAYSVFGPSAHGLVSKVLYGIGAVVATICSGFFIHYVWTERMQLQDQAILPFFVLLCLLALGAALAAWVGLFRSDVSDSYESGDDP